MARTVAEIEKRLARMLGAGGTDPVSELADGEAEDLRDYVQSVYTQCFIPIDGHRPKWSEQILSLSFRAPITVTLTLTNGSQAVAGAPSIAIAGERVLIGENIYVYAGNDQLLHDWNGTTGTHQATFYQVAQPLPGDVSGIEAPVQCLEHGPLQPLMDEEQELLMRSFYQNDFWPIHETYRVLANTRRYRTNAKGFDSGDPWYYYVESAAVSPDRYPTPIEPSGAIQTEDAEELIEVEDITYDGPVPAHYISQRMHLYPFPDHAVTVQYKATINPQIVDGNTSIHLPADVIEAVFMPLCREQVAMNFPDYAGDNKSELVELANRARAQLRTLARPQRRRSGPLSPSVGW
jgi:hypothetical protein